MTLAQSLRLVHSCGLDLTERFPNCGSNTAGPDLLGVGWGGGGGGGGGGGAELGRGTLVPVGLHPGSGCRSWALELRRGGDYRGCSG
uniref:Uncharacterized protein n=1 Tax=Knipowitschia caucasica TaxID=637954 RepID=A0AAV2LIU5_KNICA